MISRMNLVRRILDRFWRRIEPECNYSLSTLSYFGMSELHETGDALGQCSVCGDFTAKVVLSEAHWYPHWEKEGGACPGCVQESLLRTLLARGDEALHEAVQTVWPLDAEAAFGVLPTRLRLHADPRFSGRGVTIALVDSGFYPHPDLIRPHNRIRVWADATQDPISVVHFDRAETQAWPGWDGANSWQWHGTMTSTVAAGNGFLSHGLYSGLAYSADLVLIQVRDSSGSISSANIERALNWIGEFGPALGVRIVSLSVSGDPVSPLAGNPVDEAVGSLVSAGISVVAASGNDGVRSLLPPATAPLALTIGGLDDGNSFNDEELAVWHSNYGTGSNDVPKPELVAPSIWVAAPVLPDSEVAQEARLLFERGWRASPKVRKRMEELKLITPHYQHVEGTSFAAPIIASTIACMIEANSSLTPLTIRSVLLETAHLVPGADRERQGAGAVSPGRAVALAQAERHSATARPTSSPVRLKDGVAFSLHDHSARQVEVLGSWNSWQTPGLQLTQVEDGYWQSGAVQMPPGRYAYKFLLDGERWLDDPWNPSKVHDGAGGLNSSFAIDRATM